MEPSSETTAPRYLKLVKETQRLSFYLYLGIYCNNVYGKISYVPLITLSSVFVLRT